MTMNSDRIEAFDFFSVTLPTIRRHRFAHHGVGKMRYLIVRMRTRDGIEGWGEAGPPGGPWWGGESVETCRTIIETYFVPRLIGAPLEEHAALMVGLGRVVAKNHFAKAAVEMALLDARAKHGGMSVADLLGGRRRDVLPVRWALGAGPVASMRDEIAAKREAGFRKFKVKMGAAPLEEDLKRVEQIIDEVGEGRLVGDPNGGWTVPEAKRAAHVLEAMGLEALEQPLPRGQTRAMAMLRQGLRRMPIIADESVGSPQECLEVATCNAADIVAVKYAKCGGLAQGLGVATVADAAHLGIYGGTALETSLGTAAQLQLFAVCPRLDFGSELVGPGLLQEDIVVDPLRPTDGKLAIPNRPGWGVEIDEARLLSAT